MNSCEACPGNTWSTGGIGATCTAIPEESHVVVIIEFYSSSDVSAQEVETEIERVSGFQVEVVEISKGKFEVTVIDGGSDRDVDLAKRISSATRDGTSNLLRQVKKVEIRVDNLSSSSSLFHFFSSSFFFMFEIIKFFCI